HSQRRPGQITFLNRAGIKSVPGTWADPGTGINTILHAVTYRCTSRPAVSRSGGTVRTRQMTVYHRIANKAFSYLLKHRSCLLALIRLQPRRQRPEYATQHQGNDEQH